MKIWQPAARSRLPVVSFGIAGIVLLALAVAVLAGLAGAAWGASAWEMLAMTLLGTALCVMLALQLSKRARRATLIFCRDCEGRLYFVDVMAQTRFRRGIAGFAAMDAEARRTAAELCAPGGYLQRRLEIPGGLEGEYPQILAVESLAESSRQYTLRCRVRYPNGGEAGRKLLLVKGYEDEELLLRELDSLLVPEI